MEELLSHLDAAYNLARWLTRNDTDAEDVVQEAYLRAFKYYGSFKGGDCRKWLLSIVRNTCYTWLSLNRSAELGVAFDEEIHTPNNDEADPETILIRGEKTQLLKLALEELPVEFKEVVILRELEGMSYQEIAQIANIPVGTVMSRLARARKRLRAVLTREPDREPERTQEVMRRPLIRPTEFVITVLL
ncbi:MAG TPA: sigma-70 family RNA polymerase sigma factor [Pyrinomonadaceae bacterium]|jgi:RNA polymerase sigma-70 factor (ECF subfamily)